MICVAARFARSGLPARVVVVGAVDEERYSAGARYPVDRMWPDAVVIGEPSGSSCVGVGYEGNLRFSIGVSVPAAHTSSPAAGAVEVAPPSCGPPPGSASQAGTSGPAARRCSTRHCPRWSASAATSTRPSSRCPAGCPSASTSTDSCASRPPASTGSRCSSTCRRCARRVPTRWSAR
ncbi:hypothetical protein ACWCQW_52325 [Streptomyces mirabilis]